MERTCSKCGALTPPEARFCRHCGTPLRSVSGFGTSEQISPLAQTVPLSGEGLTTSSLGTNDAEGTASDTKRVAHAEMERLLRQSRFEATANAGRDVDSTTAINSDYAAPPTGELTEKPQAPAVSPSSPLARTAANAATATTSTHPQHRSRALIMAMLLLAALSGAVLAYYFLRQRTPASASSAADGAINSNQAIASVNTNSTVVEAGAVDQTQTSGGESQSEEKPQPSPTPSASVEPTRDARKRQEQRESATATPTPAVAQTTASPTPTPLAQTTPAQTTPSQPNAPATANSNNSATQAAQTAGYDDFYFQAVNLLNGRAPRALPRAELLRALQLFQNVKSGPHAVEARRQAARLGRELDRQNKQPQR
ncbi:MAG TPA: zinc-ribbon domain-containing protein [Pyrinomonadaceae bacterium]